jgi:4-alpha-glucanotransferase
MKTRGSGILIHLTSLPSPFGIGDMGPSAYRFVDFLAESSQRYWQMLPLNPTDPTHYSSPYHSFSAFACNPLLISPEALMEEGLLDRSALESPPPFPRGKVDYGAVIQYKQRLFGQAYARFVGEKGDHEYARFCLENAGWLDDFALFMALKSHLGGKAWSEWPPEIRDRESSALDSARHELGDRIEREKFLQYLFARQWVRLKGYCQRRSVQVIGDIPIYVNYDSVDLWVHPELFKLDEDKRPYVVAGVPPDYFSETGQLWGNPLYRWDVLKETGYAWWVQRVARTLELFDFVRIDHFRGLVAYWEVPATERTAVRGRWIEAPALDFLNHLTKRFPCLPIIAEDLGVITPDVREIMHRFELPGMKLLLFAFGDDPARNPYTPHNLPQNSIAYTGTHDNNTVKGWFRKEATPEIKERLFRYVGREVPLEDLHWELIRLVMMSVANTVIFPIQDVLGLGEEARMNRPSTLLGNWEWRLSGNMIAPEVAHRLREMTEIYGRS